MKHQHNHQHLIVTYFVPILIFISILGLLIYAYVHNKEGFEDCSCPSNSTLRNGGCYSCEPGYKLNDDYYNAHCIALDPSAGTKPAIVKQVTC